MPEPDTTSKSDSAGDRPEPMVTDAIESTESYETEEGVVFYDAENPLAWIQVDGVVDLTDVA